MLAKRTSAALASHLVAKQVVPRAQLRARRGCQALIHQSYTQAVCENLSVVPSVRLTQKHLVP